MSPINTSHLRHFMGKRNSRTDNALYDGIHFCGSPLSRSLYGRFQCNQLELHHAIISLSEMISSELCKWPWTFFLKKKKNYIHFVWIKRRPAAEVRMPSGWHGRVVFPRSKHFLLGFLPSKYKQKYSGLSGELNTERAMNERVNEWRDTAWDKGKVLTGVSPLVVRWGPRLHSANFFIHCPSFHGRQIRFTILGTLPLRPDIFSFQRCRHLFYFLNNSLTRLLFLQFCAAVPEFQRFQCDSWNRSFHRRLQGRTSSIQSIEIFSQNKVHTVSPVLFFSISWPRFECWNV